MPRLSGKLCLVTGAARGIGKGISRAFADEGADVIVTVIDPKTGRSRAEAIGATFYELDVSNEANWLAHQAG